MLKTRCETCSKLQMYSDDLRDELYCGTTSAHYYSIDSANYPALIKQKRIHAELYKPSHSSSPPTATTSDSASGAKDEGRQLQKGNPERQGVPQVCDP